MAALPGFAVTEKPATENFDVEEFLRQEQSKDLLRFTTAGSVDDGKSTLIGRLLHDARGAYEDQLKQAIRGAFVEAFRVIALLAAALSGLAALAAATLLEGRRRSRKPVGSQGPREFKSLPLRSSSPPYFHAGASKQRRCEAPPE